MEKTAEHHTAAAARQTRMLVMTALFAALGYVATRVLQVPSPSGGYLNLGDAVVLLGAYLLGPVYGAAAGGLGPLWRIFCPAMPLVRDLVYQA